MSDARPTRVLFVCTGNICRSPMAEGIARDYAARIGKAIEVRSASTLGMDGYPADPHAVAVCREEDIDLTGHRSTPLSEDLVKWADYVLVMELRHAQKIRDEFPEVGERLLMLGTFGGVMEIADPIGGWRFRFRRSRDEIRNCVQTFIDRLPAQRR